MVDERGLVERWRGGVKESGKQGGGASGEEFLIQGDMLGRAKAPDDH